jgi:hypothetical protein
LLNGIPCLVLQAPSFVELCYTALLSFLLAKSSLNSIKNCDLLNAGAYLSQIFFSLFRHTRGVRSKSSRALRLKLQHSHSLVARCYNFSLTRPSLRERILYFKQLFAPRCTTGPSIDHKAYSTLTEFILLKRNVKSSFSSCISLEVPECCLWIFNKGKPPTLMPFD